MPLSKYPLDEINEGILQSLIGNGIPEGETIEYKSELPGKSEKDRKELCADVSSFANSKGGDVIYGIKAEKGIPKELVGLDVNQDQEMMRLEQKISSGIDPKIPGLQIRSVNLENGKMIIVIRIPRSWIKPHMVTFNDFRFHIRRGARKDFLDVNELREAFTFSETIFEQMKRFCAGQIIKILSEDTVVKLHERPKMVIHIIPYSFLNPRKRIDLKNAAKMIKLMTPLGGILTHYRFNIDGFLTYGKAPSSESVSCYLQLFRSGIIESVDSYSVGDYNDGKFVPQYFEDHLKEALQDYLELLMQFRVDTPIMIKMNMLGVKGHKMGISDLFPQISNLPIDKDHLDVPEVIIDSYDFNFSAVLKELSDYVWQAAGWQESPRLKNEESK